MVTTSFGRALRRHRTLARLSQDDLAGLAGLSARALRDLESGRVRRPRNDTIRLLAVALRLTGEDLTAFERTACDDTPDATADHPASDHRAIPATGAAATLPPVPRELPPDTGGFVGRARELAELDRLLLGGEPTDGPAAAAVVTGAAGVGKTALAVRWAHHAAPLFPDGQLYVNLHGYDTKAAVRPIDALARFLRVLGTPPASIPTEVDEAAARFRSLAAARRMLVVLDNAATAAQVRRCSRRVPAAGSWSPAGTGSAGWSPGRARLASSSTS